MAQLIVARVDKPDANPYVDCMAHKRGDVVNVYADDIQLESYPGVVEQIKQGFWTIVKAPDVDPKALSAFLAPEPGDRLLNRMLQRRAFKFNIDAQEAQPVAAYDLATCLAMKVAKPALADPAVLVDDPAVLG